MIEELFVSSRMEKTQPGSKNMYIEDKGETKMCQVWPLLTIEMRNTDHIRLKHQ